MPAPSIDPGDLVNSRLADTAPALIGVVVILLVVLGTVVPVGVYMARMLRDAIRDAADKSSKSDERTANAIEKNAEVNSQVAAALVVMNDGSRTRETASHAWQAEQARVMAGIGHQLEQCGTKLTEVHEDVRHIKTSLGKD